MKFQFSYFVTPVCFLFFHLRFFMALTQSQFFEDEVTIQSDDDADSGFFHSYKESCYSCDKQCDITEASYFRDCNLCHDCFQNDDVIKCIIEMKQMQNRLEHFNKNGAKVDVALMMEDLRQTCFKAMRIQNEGNHINL